MDKKFDYTSGLNTLQIELSSNCNALCLGCVRTNENFTGTREGILKNQILPIDMIFDLLNTEAGQKISRIEFCGNIDEPLAHPQFLELLEGIYERHSKMAIHIHTNGSLRNEAYHIKLGELISKFHPSSVIRYSLDGFGKTHSFYRQNTDFDKIFANLKAACTTQASVIWQFLIFPWNKHQVPAAREMAAQIGCKEFWVRPDRSKVTEAGEVYIKVIKGVEGFTTHKKFLLEKHWPRREEDSIICRFREGRSKMAFLSWEGKVWPCCFHSNVLYDNKGSREAYEREVLKDCNENFNSLYSHSFDEVMSHPFFTQYLMKSWEDPQDPRAWRCVEKCKSSKIRSSDQKNDHANNHGIVQHQL